MSSLDLTRPLLLNVHHQTPEENDMETQEAEKIIKTRIFLGKKCLGVGAGSPPPVFKMFLLIRLSKQWPHSRSRNITSLRDACAQIVGLQWE